MNRMSIISLAISITLISISLWFYTGKRVMKKGILSEQIASIEDVKQLFPQSPQEIKQQLEQYIAEAKKAIEQIIAVPDSERTFANTAQALDHLSALSNLAVKSHVFSIVEMVSTDEHMRNAAHEAVVQAQEFWVDHVSNNKQLFNAFKAYVEGDAGKEQLNQEQQYYLKEVMDDFIRAGLDLPDEQLQHVKALKKELSKLVLEFDKNIAADTSSITVERNGLKGLDEAYINTLKQTDDGAYILGVDYPTYFRIMDHCMIEDTRKRLYEAFSNRAYPANEQLLKEIISKRDELAKKLGFASYAALDLADQMAQKPTRAQEFVEDLIARSKKKAQQELDTWTAELPESVSLTRDKKIKPWDVRFLETSYKKKNFDLDERTIAQYFPMEKTIEGLLDIYRQFLGVEFEEVPVLGFWHKDLKLVKVYTADKSQMLGYLMLDLFPRPHKYSHACHAGIIPGVKKPDGSRIPTISVVLANFPKPSDDKPALLMRGDVT